MERRGAMQKETRIPREAGRAVAPVGRDTGPSAGGSASATRLSGNWGR